jgi:hypothetical protein
VRRQSWRDFEHAVIDGGSTDGKLDILKAAGNSMRWYRSATPVSTTR